MSSLILLLLTLLTTACERPLQPTNQRPATVEVENSRGYPAAAQSLPPGYPPATLVSLPTAMGPTPVEVASAPSVTPGGTPETALANPPPGPTETGNPLTPAVTPSASGAPQIHVVTAGDNLYRLGLHYGLSWLALAEYNNLTNPDQLTVGQELRIPGGEEIITPTPSPATETMYMVRPGDTLYRIAQAFQANWMQIAEANGLVNPNQLHPGQVLKIVATAPGPRPPFVHVVQRGETLFLIALRYGLPWPAIAEANSLIPPYVIYPGQSLIIPGG
ncbi:MAG: LysM peptidoglycan-binding domain-containing protein [Chloroflexota bacterium]